MFSNDKNLPLSLAVMLAHDEYPEHREWVISVTTLLKPIKQIILGMRVAKNNVHSVKDISGRIASSYGTAIHNALEASWTEGGCRGPDASRARQELGQQCHRRGKIS